jgi:hypothetical protein
MTIKSDSVTVRGKLSFMHLLEADDFNGKGKPMYKFRLTNLSDAAVDAIEERFGEDAGLGHKRIKFNEAYPDAGKYTGFASGFPIKVMIDGKDAIVGGRDENGKDVAKVIDPIASRIGYGSEAVVRIIADKSDNPRAAFIDIIDLVTFDDDGTSDTSYDADAVL